MQKNVPLSPLTTLGVGGLARWFVSVQDESEIAEALLFARKRKLPVFILGGGSNLLISDKGFNGVVVKIALRGIERSTLPDGRVSLQVGSGEDWDSLVRLAVCQDLAGLKCLAGIPGTTGATPVQNVGAYGQEVSETIHSLRCIDVQSLEVVGLSNSDCGFAYRSSVFNTTDKSRFVISRVDFALTPLGAANLQYSDLRNRFADHQKPTLAQVSEAIREIRRRKGMVIDKADVISQSCGSLFS